MFSIIFLMWHLFLTYVSQKKLYFPNNIANAVSVDFSFVNGYFFYIPGYTGLGILNVIEISNHLNTMQNNCVVQIRLHILAIVLLRTTASSNKDHPVFLVEKRSNWTTKLDLLGNWTTLWCKRTTNC